MTQIAANFDEVLDALQELRESLPEANEAAVVAATDVYDDHLGQRIDVIYGQPLPESMAKRGQERTGQLRAGRTGITLNHGDETIGIVEIRGPARNYARRRNYLESIPNPFFDETIDMGSGDAHAAALAAVVRTLKL